MRLTPYEQSMLDGKYGRLKQICMGKIIQYAEVLGADELCTVTKATVYMGAHPYLEAVKSDNYDEIFSKMYVCANETIPLTPFAEECFSQTCVGTC
jgi:hypothetical protein